MTSEEVRHCINCNRTHVFDSSGWYTCDPLLPHGFMTYTGMEGRCQHCGGEFSSPIHERIIMEDVL